MKYDKSKNYTGEELESLIDQAKEYGAQGTFKRFEKDYVAKTEFDKVNKEFSSLQTTYKTEKHDEVVNKVFNELGVKDNKKDYVKQLGNISIDDTPEKIKEKVGNLKQDLSEFFNATPGISLDPKKAVQDSKPKTKEQSPIDLLNPIRF